MMFKCCVIIIFVALVNGTKVSNPLVSKIDRIVNGEEIDIKKVPYQVSIHGSKIGLCSGSIIDFDLILTSAQCVNYGINSLLIRAGTSMLNTGLTIHRAKDVILHMDFKIDPFYMPVNDIALVRVDPPFEFDENHQKVKLVDRNQQFTPDTDSTITGWGGLSNNGSYSNKLRMVHVPVISKSECSMKYVHMGGISNNQICTDDIKSGKGPCSGDLGGPMTIGGLQAGIVSWGQGCGGSRYPAVYTEIASYRDWISSHMSL